MKYLLLIFLSGIHFSALAQNSSATQYLIATFEMKYDKPNEYYYFIIVPQRGADTMNPVYSLVKYDNRKKGINTEADYFYNHNDTSSRLFNYFVSPTEGLNYMSSIGWRVMNIYPEISSGSKSEQSGENLVPITTVASKPVFCFKKEPPGFEEQSRK